MHDTTRTAIIAITMATALISCGGGSGGGNGNPTVRGLFADDVSMTTVNGSSTISIQLDGSHEAGHRFVLMGHPTTGAVNLDAATGIAQLRLPSPDYVGTISFPYTVADSDTIATTATATIRIERAPTAETFLLSYPMIMFDVSDGSTKDGLFTQDVQLGISADGRHVAFTSSARAFDSSSSYGNYTDVFVRDMAIGTIDHISRRPNGSIANGNSGQPMISADGNLVAFCSAAETLIDDDTNDCIDLFLHDRRTGITSRISQAIDGTQADADTLNFDMSPDGRFIVFITSGTGLTDDAPATIAHHLYLLDREGGTLTSIADAAHSYMGSRLNPQVSDDGATVLFLTSEEDLTGSGDASNQVYLWSADTGTFQRISEYQGTPADMICMYHALSGDGSIAAFITSATTLADTVHDSAHYRIYIYRRSDHSLALLEGSETPIEQYAVAPQLSSDGRYCVYQGYDAEQTPTLQLWKADLTTGTRSLIGPETGADGDGDCVAISPDARYAAYHSLASTLTPFDDNDAYDVFWVDTIAGTASTRLVSAIPPNTLPTTFEDSVSLEGMSDDGHYLVMQTYAENAGIGRNDTSTLQVYLHDDQAGIRKAISINSDGANANGLSSEGDVSNDGQRAVFISAATNLCSEDTHSNRQVYLRDEAAGTTTLISAALDPGQGANFYCSDPVISRDGSTVAFVSRATNLTTDVDGGDGNANDIFVCDVATGTIRLVSVSTTPGVSGNGHSSRVSLNHDGSICFFTSEASNLVADDTNGHADLFKADLTTGVITRVSLTNDGQQPDGRTSSYSVSADGNLIAFTNAGSNLTAGIGSTSERCVFLRDLSNGTTTLISRSIHGGSAAGYSAAKSITADGRYVSFVSDASDVIAEAFDGPYSLFIYDRHTDHISLLVEGVANGGLTADGSAVIYQSGQPTGIYRSDVVLSNGG